MVILTLSLLVRVWNIKERFALSGESYNLLYNLEEFVSGRHSPLVGLEAAQYVHHLFHLPWYLYAMTPIFLVGRGNPIAFAMFHAASEVIEVYLLYRIGKRIGGERAGLMAALIWALWEKAIFYHKFISPVGLVSLGVIVAIYLGFTAWRYPHGVRFFVLGLWTGMSVSFHYQLLMLVGTAMSVVWWKQRKYIWQTAAGVIVAFSPLIIFDVLHPLFNLTGLWYVARSLFDESRPYSSIHFLYQLYPIGALLAAIGLSKVPARVALILLGLFVVIQLPRALFYRVHPNYTHQEQLAKEMLGYWDNGLSVYFVNQSSFDYAYLLRWEAKQRGLNPKNIVIYEPWQPENNAPLVVEGNGTLVYSRE